LPQQGVSALRHRVDESNIIKFGRSNRGVQRYRCKSCKSTFAATRGTLVYRKRTAVKDIILETLALLAEGVRISSLSRAKGFKEDTILSWLCAKPPGIRKPSRKC
jgi:transposase-like protein